MHENEVVITKDNYDELMKNAERLSKKHVQALKEQRNRQKQFVIVKE